MYVGGLLTPIAQIPVTNCSRAYLQVCAPGDISTRTWEKNRRITGPAEHRCRCLGGDTSGAGPASGAHARECQRSPERGREAGFHLCAGCSLNWLRPLTPDTRGAASSSTSCGTSVLSGQHAVPA